MKKILALLIWTLCTPVLADGLKIGVVNLSELYNKSVFIQKTSDALQKEVQGMEEKLQAQKTKVQNLIATYEKTPNDKKKAVAQQITTEQTKLNDMSQNYQKKIHADQTAGMQKFTDLVKTSVEKIAKEKHLNAVFNTSSVIYTDNSWVDITHEVDAAMPKE